MPTLAVVIAACSNPTPSATPTPSPPAVVTAVADHMYTCEELGPEKATTDADTRASYQRALAEKGLVNATLESIEIGANSDVDSPEELDKLLGQKAKAWEIIRYNKGGQRRPALVGEVTKSGAEGTQVELVSDAHAGVWRVVRVPRERAVKTVNVAACQWGCFSAPPAGDPDAGPPTYSRRLWLLPENATYRGEVRIEYDAPMLLMNNTKHCDLPS